MFDASKSLERPPRVQSASGLGFRALGPRLAGTRGAVKIRQSFKTQDGAIPYRHLTGSTIGLGQDAQLVLSGDHPAARPGG